MKARRAKKNPSRSKKKMAKGSAKRRKAMKAFWARRRAAGKRGRLGSTVRARRRKSAAPKSKRARARKSATPRKRKRRQPAGLRRFWEGRRAAGKRGRPGHTKRKARSRRRTRKLSLSRGRARLAIHPGALQALSPTVRANPSRRRRRRRSRRSYTTRRRRSRRTHAPMRRRRRRSRRSYRARRSRSRRSLRRSFRRSRRNPGLGDITAMLKHAAVGALPVLGGFAAVNLVNSRLLPMVPGLSSLGTLQGPVSSVLSLIATHLAVGFGAKHSAMVARNRTSLMVGAGAQTVLSVFKALVPSVTSMLGLGDYIQMGDYVAVGATPLRENFTLSDYVAVGSDGVSEELGLEEELGVEEELGAFAADGYLGGMPGGPRLMKQVPRQNFLQPVPARSFTKQIPAAGTAYDNASDVYTGIFRGSFGS